VAIVDIFRLEHRKIVKHRAVIQPVPETAANPDKMF
jgi:predicted SnoaL-like aldol condensation-catalyzing enzyme